MVARRGLNFADMETQAKMIMTAFAAAGGAFFRPMIPCALLCTVMVFLDFHTAVKLGRRVRRRAEKEGGHPAGAAGDAGKLRSRGFGRSVGTLMRVYCLLVVARLVQVAIVDGSVDNFDCVKGASAAVCFWQLLSILENESSCNPESRIAGILRRYLVDKSRRHLDFPPEGDDE